MWALCDADNLVCKFAARTRKSFVGVISYALGVAATFFNVHLAFVLYALTALFLSVRRNRPKTRE